jgi:hypothetical protein
MPLRQGSTGASTHAPGAPSGSGQRNPANTLLPSVRRTL